MEVGSACGSTRRAPSSASTRPATLNRAAPSPRRRTSTTSRPTMNYAPSPSMSQAPRSRGAWPRPTSSMAARTLPRLESYLSMASPPPHPATGAIASFEVACRQFMIRLYFHHTRWGGPVARAVGPGGARRTACIHGAPRLTPLLDPSGADVPAQHLRPPHALFGMLMHFGAQPSTVP